MEYQVEWDDEGEIFCTWEEEAKVSEDLKREYWFGQVKTKTTADES